MSRKKAEPENCLVLRVTDEDDLEICHMCPATLTAAKAAALQAIKDEGISLHVSYVVAELKFATKPWHGDYENVPLITESE